MQGEIDYSQYNEVAARLPEYRKAFRLFAAEQLVARKKPPNPRLVPLSPFLPTQERMVRSIERQQREMGFIRHVIMKQRQQCGSTLVLGLLYHLGGINPFTNTFTSAHDLETAETLFRTVKLFQEELHPAIRPKTRRSTVRQLLFEDEQNPEQGLRSSMTVDTAKKISFAIGRTLSALHFSEVSRYELVSGKDQVRFAMSAAVNAVPLAPGTAVILESTAFVTGSYFKEMVEIARRNEGPWRFVFVPWFVSPDYKVPLQAGQDSREEGSRSGL